MALEPYACQHSQRLIRCSPTLIQAGELHERPTPVVRIEHSSLRQPDYINPAVHPPRPHFRAHSPTSPTVRAPSPPPAVHHHGPLQDEVVQDANVDLVAKVSAIDARRRARTREGQTPSLGEEKEEEGDPWP